MFRDTQAGDGAVKQDQSKENQGEMEQEALKNDAAKAQNTRRAEGGFAKRTAA